MAINTGNGSGTPWWISWPFIIILFAMGLGPVAFALLMIRIFGENDGTSKKKAAASTGRDTAAQETIRKMQAKSSEGKKASKKKKIGRTIKLLRGFGIALAVFAAFNGAEAVAGLLDGWHFYLEQLINDLVIGGCGVGMIVRAQFLANQERMIQRYKKAIGREKCIDLDTVAKRVNRTQEKCAKELQKLLDKGLLADDFYIDYENELFLKFGAEPEPEPEPEPDPVPPEVDQGYSGVLRNLRRANDRIADEELSRKIDRLEQISGLIFKAVEEDPSKRDRIRSFFDYYLPTTQKLLDAYADFDEIGVDGEHLREAKERIEATMDSIVEGFEHQLDQLYSADAMDVVSDIKVMETILNRDTASVAKDFGAPEKAKKSTSKTAPAEPWEQKSETKEPWEQQTMQ